ncbi:MAG: RHS repeat protein [Planctomycetaceae bacterium]|nr:RHS repeat protein [Planctomycetaceae bacterium]
MQKGPSGRPIGRKPIGKPIGDTQRKPSTSYDKAGNVKTQTDAKNKVTTTIYDVLGRTESVTDRLTNATAYANDLAGRMISITDAQACFLVQNHQLRRQCTGAVNCVPRPKKTIPITRAGTRVMRLTAK